jgi:SNF2 family DNA or RNA helicase
MQVINIACIKKQQRNYKHCLIICGVNGLKWNWKAEVEKHSNESAWILGTRWKKDKEYIGTVQDRLDDLIDLEYMYKKYPNGNFNTYNSLYNSYFLITNIETLRNEKIIDKLKELCDKGIINMIAGDEFHRVKDPTSQQGKAILKLQAETMISMTGTPLMNNPLDLYIHLKWLGYEKHAFYSFKQHYCIFGGFGGYQIMGYKNLDQLKEQFDDIMLRRLKKDVLDLPEKIYTDEYVEMTPKQAKIYKEVTMEVQNNIDKVESAINPLSEMIRMRQATDYTGILSSTIQESAKLDRLDELLEEIVANGGKAIVFSNWTSMTNPTYERLKQYNPAIITGETKDRVEQEKKFMEDNSCKVIVGTVGAMGTGLTLTAANTVIFLDEPWNQAIKQQAEDRAHRIGTKENINIITLMCKNTIDEKIHDIVAQKGRMSDLLIDGKLTKQNRHQLVSYLLS